VDPTLPGAAFTEESLGLSASFDKLLQSFEPGKFAKVFSLAISVSQKDSRLRVLDIEWR